MDNGRNRGKFSEGGRMGFEPVESVGLAAKESAQEILKIFNQVHEPRVVQTHSFARPAPNAQWVARAYLIGQRSVHGWGVAARPPTLPRSACLPAPPLALRLHFYQYRCSTTAVPHRLPQYRRSA